MRDRKGAASSFPNMYGFAVVLRESATIDPMLDTAISNSSSSCWVHWDQTCGRLSVSAADGMERILHTRTAPLSLQVATCSLSGERTTLRICEPTSRKSEFGLATRSLTLSS